MTVRADVSPKLLMWACERSGHDVDALMHRFERLPAWISGETKPTLKQLEEFAKATHTPVGYLFLTEPPVDRLPIPDLRTVADRVVRRPSVNLLEVIYANQQRQAWYREFALGLGAEALSFVGSASLNDEPLEVAARIRAQLGFEVGDRATATTWEDALRRFRERADALGVLVMSSGIVGNNTHRALDPSEFRGFALIDDVAPLVFINGADAKAAQMFTLAHELAHVWLGESGVSEVGLDEGRSPSVETWCNHVAAELLVPRAEIHPMFDRRAELVPESNRIAKHFKVSTLVVLRRLVDFGLITRRDFRAAYDAELNRSLVRRESGGGDFYATQRARLGERFARSVATSTLEGHTLYRDAFRLLGVGTTESFDQFALRLGVA